MFLGVDAEGRRASVAVLNRGAAGDAAARDRFRAAINAAVPAGGVPGRGGGPGAGSGGGPGPGEPAPVVAAQPDGPAPWVATAYEPDRPGAERFLEPVMFRGSGRSWWGGRRRGPQFQPYWLGSQEPALERSEPPPGAVPPVEQPPQKSLVAVILGLVALLLVLALLMGLLFACQPEATEPPPAPPEPTPTFEQPSRSPSPSPTSPSPSPSRPSSPGIPTPSPSGTGGDDGAPL